MKLALKFAFVLALGILVVLGANAAFRVRREIALFETDSRRDGQHLGRVLAGAVERIWGQVGESQALDLVEDANSRQEGFDVRWVWNDAFSSGDANQPVIPFELLQPLQEGFEVSVRHTDEMNSGAVLYSYVPVSTPDGRLGAIEVGESLLNDRLYIQRSILQALVTTVALVALCGILATGLGMMFVGRPIQLLVDRARRVGLGDLSGRLMLKQHDEIGELAEEINAMCDQLSVARERATQETAARLTAVEQLRHADRLRAIGQIASGIGHELGTPLNVVGGRAQIIVNKHAPGSQAHENAAIILEQTKRMTVTIRELLDFARRRQPQKSLCDMRRIIDHTLTMLRPLADKQRVSLSVEGDTPQAVADVDWGQIQQVLINLIMNGIQSMPERGRLTVGLSHVKASPRTDGGGEANYLRIHVEDEGQGMPQDVLERVFEPFFTTKKKGEGTGLGLSLARDIVEEHGGWIDAQSEVGKRTCFFVYLPEAMSNEL